MRGGDGFCYCDETQGFYGLMCDDDRRVDSFARKKSSLFYSTFSLLFVLRRRCFSH